jgi:hypothetical protein
MTNNLLFFSQKMKITLLSHIFLNCGAVFLMNKAAGNRSENRKCEGARYD